MSSAALVNDPPDDRVDTGRVALVEPAPVPETEPEAAPAAAGWARRDVALLVGALAVGVVIRVALAEADHVLTNDASAYLESGRNLLDGRGFTRGSGRPELHFPPVPPVLLGAAWDLTGDPLAAVGLVNVVTSSLALLPLAGLAGRLGGVRAAVAAAWIAALAPGVTEVPFVMGGGSESPYLLLLLTTVWLVATLPDRRGRGRWGAAGLAGLSAGLTYLTRPEGLVLVLVLVGVAAVGTRAMAGRRGRARALAPLGVLLGVMAMVMAPYVLHLHRHTGSWELTAKSQDADMAAWRAVAENDRPARDAVLYELDDSGLGLRAGTEPLSALVRDDPAGYAGIVGVNLRTLADQFTGMRANPPAGPFPRWVLLPLPVALLAAWGAWSSRRSFEGALALAVAGVVTATAVAFFVQPRYLVPLVAVLCAFAGVGLARLPARSRAAATAVAAVLLVGPVLVAVPGPRTMFHPREPVEHVIAGEWLARRAAPGDRVMTRSLITAFAAGRETVVLPVGTVPEVVRFARHHGVEHLVADEFLLRDYRPGLAPLFGPGPWPGLELEHEFRVAERLTRIFRVVDPGPDTADPPSLGFVGDG